MTMLEKDIQAYLNKHGFEALHLKAVLFDMDGVLFDSMPRHARAWEETSRRYGLDLTYDEAYMHEGRTGKSTINILFNRLYHRDATDAEAQEIYATKAAIFNAFPEPQAMPGALSLLQELKRQGFQIVLVTGSGQKTLIQRTRRNFPGIFHPELMITSFDVRHGKPDPEPYLKGLRKAGVQPWEALVVENAPLGIRAGVTADIFTVALNTGPLPDSVLLGEGANALFHSMQKFSTLWPRVQRELA